MSNCITVDDLVSTLRLLEQQRSLDAKILTELLRAVTRCQDPDAPDRAKTILLKRASDAQLNAYHFNAVLNGYAKRRGYDKKAERLLNEMQRLHEAGNITDAPNTISHNIVLDSLSKSREKDALERAEVMLRRMEQNPHTRPDFFSFTSLFNLYSKNAEGDKAERLLDRVIAMEETGALREKPNALTYRCVIDALAKSGEEPERAEEILDLQNERSCEFVVSLCDLAQLSNDLVGINDG
jgi:pentatricopeptide repeat protein